MPGPVHDLTAEFAAFREASYPELVAQVVAVTGDEGVARAATDVALAAARDDWESLGGGDDALARVRWVAMLAAEQVRPERGQGRPLDTGEPEDAVVVEALLRLPLRQRRILVLHYMAGLPVAELAELTGVPEPQVDDDLDEGFAAIATSIVWDRPPAADDGTEPWLEWTADALADTASRLVNRMGRASP